MSDEMIDGHLIERSGDDVLVLHPAGCLVEMQAADGGRCPVFDRLHAEWGEGDRSGELATYTVSRMSVSYNPADDVTLAPSSAQAAIVRLGRFVGLCREAAVVIGRVNDERPVLFAAGFKEQLDEMAETAAKLAESLRTP